MPVLGTLIMGLINLLVGWFARVMVLEKAAKLAAWTVALGLITALVASMFSATGALSAAISGMSSSHPAFAMGLGIAVNSITMTAVTAYMSVWIACQVYVVKKKAINLVVG